MNRTNKIIAYVICFVALFAIGYILSDMTAAHTMTVNNASLPYNTETVEVIIDGEVKNPGTYSINVGMTLYDALCEAGGIAKSGDTSSLDMDMVIVTPMTVTVPKLDKSVAIAYAEYEFMSDADKHRLNVNNATVQQLVDLEGIGEALASRIVEYREKNGDFKSTEDLLNIKGIGMGKYTKFKDYITVGGE